MATTPKDPRAGRTVQPPLMADVSAVADQDEVVVEQPTPYEAVQTFAQAVGCIEALAMIGQDELIMQVARIAYTRGRQTARERGREA